MMPPEMPPFDVSGFEVGEAVEVGGGDGEGEGEGVKLGGSDDDMGIVEVKKDDGGYGVGEGENAVEAVGDGRISEEDMIAGELGKRVEEGRTYDDVGT